MIVSSMSRMGGTVGKRKRNDTAVKVDAELVRIAKVIAAYRDIPLAEYLSERLRPLIEADHAVEMEKHMPALPAPDGRGGTRPKK